MITDPPNVPDTGAKDLTIRQLVRVGLSGTRLRLRLSNAFGVAPLSIGQVTIARALSPVSPRIDPRTSVPITFGAASGVTIPAGAEYLSDPVSMKVPALATLVVSAHFSGPAKPLTGHPGSRATSYVAPVDQVAAAELQSAAKVEHWYFLSGVDVQPPAPSAAIAVLGDSITDGHGVKTDTNRRWTDVLQERLAAAHRSRAVLNLGIGGNRVLEDGLGPNALARFSRDILECSGVRYLIILEGVNDLGVLTRDSPVPPEAHRQIVERLIAAYRQMILRAHERGINVIGATIMPFAGSGYYHPGPATEADRQAINAWIRARGHFDAVVDFDALSRDPARPAFLRKDMDSGDGLHPSEAGYRAMGEAVPLSLFEEKGR